MRLLCGPQASRLALQRRNCLILTCDGPLEFLDLFAARCRWSGRGGRAELTTVSRILIQCEIVRPSKQPEQDTAIRLRYAFSADIFA